VVYPSRHDNSGVSLLTGDRGERLALALEQFFGDVNPVTLVSGEREGLGEQDRLLRLLRDFVEVERRAILKYHRQGALGIEVVKEQESTLDKWQELRKLLIKGSKKEG